MLYIQKGQINDLVLNINNNSRIDFTGYTLTFTHVVSQEIKSYTISTTGASYSDNIRYCNIDLDLACNGCDLNYEGQYLLQIYGDGTDLVYTGMAFLEGTTEQGNTFTEYISNNEDNDNYIYIMT